MRSGSRCTRSCQAQRQCTLQIMPTVNLKCLLIVLNKLERRSSEPSGCNIAPHSFPDDTSEFSLRSGPEIGKTLLGRRALIVVCARFNYSFNYQWPFNIQDEVDDSRKTLQYVQSHFTSPSSCSLILHLSYALSELQKDVDKELQDIPEAQREALRTKFAIFVVHNKLKPKLASLPDDVPWVGKPDVYRTWSHRPVIGITLARKLKIYGDEFVVCRKSRWCL